MDLGPAELLIILVIVVVLFGSGRISKLGGELGEAIGNFRKGLDSSRATTTPEAPKADDTTTPVI